MGVYIYDSPLGEIVIEYENETLTSLYFNNENFKSDVRRVKNSYFNESHKDIKIVNETVKWLDIYFSGEKPNFIPCYILKGTNFQKLVWEELSKIPYGQTITYGEIAKTIAKKLNKEQISAQAVGQAVGKNPIAIIVPCHRVIGKNYKLIGYAGGIERKIQLLKLEGITI